jgi:hypothetical protein
MQQKILEPLSPMTQSSLLSFAELFSFMMSEGGRSRGQVPFANLGGGARAAADLPINDNLGQTSPPPVSFEDIMTVFRRAVREVRAGQTALEAGEGRGGDSTYFNRTIVILLHLVCLLTKLIPHLEDEKVRQSGPVGPLSDVLGRLYRAGLLYRTQTAALHPSPVRR